MYYFTTHNYGVGIKYRVNENFFDKWNPVMAYVLGYWYADGSMYPSVRGSYINVTSIDRSTIEKIKNWLSSEHTIRKDERSTGANNKTRFVLRIGNKSLYNSLIRLGLYPSKSLSVRLPPIPNKFFSHFVRGYFDGDGCVYLYQTKGVRQELIIKKLSIIFTSGSNDFLRDLLMRLKRHLNLKQSRVYEGQRAFQLRFSTADTVDLFKFLYKNMDDELWLDRKFQRFLKYFSIRPQRIDKEIRLILNKYGHVAK